MFGNRGSVPEPWASAAVGRRGDVPPGSDARRGPRRRCGRHARGALRRERTPSAVPGLGALHRPQLPLRRPGCGQRHMGPGLALLGGARCPHGPRHARRGALHACRDPGSVCRQTLLRRSVSVVCGRCPAVDPRHAALLFRRSLHADRRPALQPRMGIPGGQSPQLARTSRDASADASRVRTAAGRRDRAGGVLRRGGRDIEIQHARLVRRPHADAGQLPLPSELHRRP